jgi:adenine/guanine phosphoribosyltransferase-like PRPP-binding protein
MRKTKTYEFKNFAWDAIMTVLTGGIWLAWVVIREFQIQKR